MVSCLDPTPASSEKEKSAIAQFLWNWMAYENLFRSHNGDSVEGRLRVFVEEQPGRLRAAMIRATFHIPPHSQCIIEIGCTFPICTTEVRIWYNQDGAGASPTCSLHRRHGLPAIIGSVIHESSVGPSTITGSAIYENICIVTNDIETIPCLEGKVRKYAVIIFIWIISHYVLSM